MSLNETSASGQAQTVPKGTVIYRENDPGTEMYLVLQGCVTIFVNQNGKNLKLADVTIGDFFGEMSMLEESNRSATAITTMDSILMPVSKGNLEQFIVAHPGIAVRIMHGLTTRILEMSKTQKVQGAAPGAEISTTGSDLFSQELDCSDIDASLPQFDPVLLETFLLPKEIICPICGTKFKTKQIRDTKLKQSGRNQELRTIYQDIDPMVFEILVCPECYYARGRKEFDKVGDIESRNLKNRTAQRKEKFNLDFSAFGKYIFAISAYRLAIDCYESIIGNKGKVDDIAAGYLMRIAWMNDDMEKPEKANEARELALAKYKTAYMQGTGSRDNDHKVEYIVARLAFELGKVKEARDYMFKAVGRRDGHKVIQQLAKDGLEEIKEADKKADLEAKQAKKEAEAQE
jgi:uncharacterized protein (DUF2225 family)